MTTRQDLRQELLETILEAMTLLDMSPLPADRLTPITRTQPTDTCTSLSGLLHQAVLDRFRCGLAELLQEQEHHYLRHLFLMDKHFMSAAYVLQV